jgi:ATPase subunit of ABC transporter with duplicated ATPase domains
MGRIEDSERKKRLGGVVAEIRQASYTVIPQKEGDTAHPATQKSGSERHGDSGGERVLLKDFSYSLQNGDRIGVVGGNGVGKSTFLKLLAGQLTVTSGTLQLGETARVGYFEQAGLQLDDRQRYLQVNI